MTIPATPPDRRDLPPPGRLDDAVKTALQALAPAFAALFQTASNAEIQFYSWDDFQKIQARAVGPAGRLAEIPHDQVLGLQARANRAFKHVLGRLRENAKADAGLDTGFMFETTVRRGRAGVKLRGLSTERRVSWKLDAACRPTRVVKLIGPGGLPSPISAHDLAAMARDPAAAGARIPCLAAWFSKGLLVPERVILLSDPPRLSHIIVRSEDDVLGLLTPRSCAEEEEPEDAADPAERRSASSKLSSKPASRQESAQ